MHAGTARFTNKTVANGCKMAELMFSPPLQQHVLLGGAGFCLKMLPACLKIFFPFKISPCCLILYAAASLQPFHRRPAPIAAAIVNKGTLPQSSDTHHGLKHTQAMQMYQLCPNCTLQRLKHSTGRLQVEVMLVRLGPWFTRIGQVVQSSISITWLHPYGGSWVPSSITSHPPLTFVVERPIKVVAASVETSGELNQVPCPCVASPRKAGQGNELLGAHGQEPAVHAANIALLFPSLSSVPLFCMGQELLWALHACSQSFPCPLFPTYWWAHSSLVVGSPAGCTPRLGDRRKNPSKEGSHWRQMANCNFLHLI